MVIGFMDSYHDQLETLTAYAAGGGLSGAAAKAALRHANENVHARHWFNAMMRASTAEEYWLREVLFLKTMDARVDVWGHPPPDSTAVASTFWSMSIERFKQSLRKSTSSRESNFLGRPKPSDAFLRLRCE
jgi:hypothetical protein